MPTQEEFVQLEQLCPSRVGRNVDLSAISRWRIGGRAQLILRPSSINELAGVRKYLYERQLPHLVIGQTSNLLFADEGLHVPCIQISDTMSQVEIVGQNLYAGAGVWIPRLALSMMAAGLSGAEHICGIPGTLGGLICMNGGSQQKCIGDHVVAVESVGTDGEIRKKTRRECEFEYRRSIFQRNGDIIAGAHLRLDIGTVGGVRSKMREILHQRRSKFPRRQPNCGSVFKSNPTMYAQVGPPGAAIERLGMKGLTVGGAQVSTQHANFIVNNGRASASDVLALIHRIGNEVLRKTGFKMEAEVCYVTPRGEVLPADTVLGANVE